jgi:hypothetical protein
MEPVFDQTGKVVAWLRGEHLLDLRGQHVAFLRNYWLISYRGVYLGRFYKAWFRDLKGQAVGFLRKPSGLPTPPATEAPPAPPQPAPTPRPPLFGVPPLAVRPAPVWSKLAWDVFVGLVTEDPSPAEAPPAAPAAKPAPETVSDVDLTVTPSARDVSTTSRDRSSFRLRRSLMPAVEEVMTLVRKLSPEEVDELFRRLTAYDQSEWEKERLEMTPAPQARG